MFSLHSIPSRCSVWLTPFITSLICELIPRETTPCFQRESYFQQVGLLETGTSLKVVSTETSSYLLFVSAIHSQVRISANALIVRLPLLLDHVVSSGPERRAFSLPFIAGYSSEEEAKADARVR